MQPIENYTPLTEISKIHNRTSAVWIIASALIFSWLLLILLAPIARTLGLFGLSQSIYSFFGFFCHQISTRSFHLFEAPFAVCARCFGFYSGFFLAFMSFPLIWDLRKTNAFHRVWIFAAIIPITIDWSLGHFGIWENTHLSRALTGSILGAACGVFIVPSLAEITRFLSEKLHSPSSRKSAQKGLL